MCGFSVAKVQSDADQKQHTQNHQTQGVGWVCVDCFFITVNFTGAVLDSHRRKRGVWLVVERRKELATHGSITPKYTLPLVKNADKVVSLGM